MFSFCVKEKDRLQREENLKKAKEITITEDSSLPKPKIVCYIIKLNPSLFTSFGKFRLKLKD